MQSIKLHSHTGADGMLKLEVPMGLANTDFEIVLIVQPVTKAESSPEDLGWPTGFFEQTYGILADDPIEQVAQLEYEEREEIL